MLEWLRSLTVVDYLIVAILISATAIGWARGLVEILTGFIVFVITMFVAGRYTTAVVGWLNRTWGAQEWLTQFLERRINLPAETYKIPATAVSWQKALEWLHDIPIPEVYKQGLAQRLEAWSHSAGSQTVAHFILRQIAAGVLTALVFIVSIAVIGWVMGLLARLVSDQIKEIPLVGTANRLLGSVANVGETGIVLALIVSLVVPLIAMYGVTSLGVAVKYARLTPYLLAYFGWFKGLFFGSASGFFF